MLEVEVAKDWLDYAQAFGGIGAVVLAVAASILAIRSADHSSRSADAAKRTAKAAADQAALSRLVTDDRPVLAVDVDGVISLFGFEGPIEEVPGRFHLIDGIAHCISDAAAGQLHRLGEVYELVWATGWEDRANDHLPRILGLPGQLPCLRFNGRARFGTAHWKMAAIDEYAGHRPLAWIDDSLDESCYEWAAERVAPTLLVRTDSDVGLTEAHAETLLSWARSRYAV